MSLGNINSSEIGKAVRLLLVTLALCLLAACSSKGGAPVSDRGPATMNGKPTGTYTVRRGDTLYGIAWRYRLNYRQLGAWNNIAGPEYVIYPGQRLRLEPPTTRKRPMARPPAKPRTKVVNDQPSAVPDSKLQTHAKTRQPLEPQSNSAAKQQPQKLKLAWRWPTKGKVVQTFSSHDPERKGVRISGVSGQPVVAAEAGRVVYSGSGLVGYGNLVIIKHGGDYLTAYGYNKQLLVNEGDNVARGERIAVMGAPRNGADSMLHFEIRKQGRPIDPLPLLPRL